jgi:hypothetical protein
MTPSKKIQTGLTAVAVVGLAAAGAAVAANKLSGSTAPQQIAAGSFVAANSSSAAGTAHGFGHGGPGRGHDDLAAAAAYLGITQDALVTQLQSGKTLAQIANATSGKSAAGLIAALVADAKQHFGSNVPSDLEQHITDLVNGVRPAFGPGDGHHDHGPFGGSSA